MRRRMDAVVLEVLVADVQSLLREFRSLPGQPHGAIDAGERCPGRL
jgi:hypothetical protein